MSRPSPVSRPWRPLTVAALYGLFAALWILLSDRLVSWAIQDPALLLLANTAKGWLFVAVTTALVFGLLARRQQGSDPVGRPQPLPWWTLGLLSVVILSATVVAIAGIWRSEQRQAGEQLLAVSESKAQEIAAWHAERMHDASWLQRDREAETNWLIWRFSRSAGALDVLSRHLSNYVDGTNVRRVAVFDAQGTLAWRSAGPDLAQDVVLQDGVKQALTQGSPLRVGPWQDDAGQIRLAFLAPIALGTQAPAVVVLHIDPKPSLHPTLASWPLPQATAEAFLFRRHGDQVEYLSARRYADRAASHLPLDTPNIFTTRVLRGQALPNEVLYGPDYRGIEALGVVRAIPGTDWWLLAKQSQTELMGEAIAQSLWLLLAGALSLISLAALVHLLGQRSHLQAMAEQVTALREAQTQVRASEERYRLLAENGSDVVWLLDLPSQRLDYISPSVEHMLGRRAEELIGHTLAELLPPQDHALFDLRLQQWLAGFRADDPATHDRTEELVHPHRDGRKIIVEMVMHLIADAQGRPVQLQGVSRDITARKAAEAQVLQLSQATEQSPASVIITGLDGNIEYVNSAFERITGYQREEVMGRNPRILQSGQTPAQTYTAMWHTLGAGERWDGEVINRRKDGQLCVQSITIAPVHDQNGRVARYLSVQLDVTAQREAEETAYRLAWFDPLTGLPNRHRLMQDLADGLGADRRTEQRSAFLLINIDRFKTVNEALGHGVGDELLRQLAARLGGLCQAGDVLARLSADEFGLLLQSLPGETAAASHSASAMRTAQAVHELLLPPFVLPQGEQINVSVSVGVALLPRDVTDTPSDVLRRADTALHRAKRAGGHQAAFFDAAMGQVVSERFAIEQDLRRGLGAQELRLYLQPQVNPQGHVVSTEALVRWAHPDKGLVPPGVFISVAEESDLIAELGDWMLDQVCARLGAIRRQGRHLPIAVNVSPRQFHKAAFVPGVLRALERHGAHPADLTLEITEGVVIEQVDAVVRKMSQLTQHGVRFSIDDFGTGYSSLAYLKRLPIHELKIDKSFVQDAPHDPSDAALVEAILAVASHLRLKVVAEGVETREQADFLNQRANVVHQGYLFGRPAPADEWLTQWSDDAEIS